MNPSIHDLVATEHEVVASVSGGKDSTAMVLHLREIGIGVTPVFMDTGWEHPDTYAYLRGPLTHAIGPITWLRAEVDLPPEREAMALEIEGMLGHYSAMVRLCLKKMMMPARKVRWCTQAAKVEPMHRWLATRESDSVSVVGIRHEESDARASMSEWEWSDKLDMWTWRPIIRWTMDDVVAIHARHGLTPNPLYLRGASRVGCWPCIFARKAEIRMLADIDPKRVEVLRRLEEMIATLYATTKAALTPRGGGTEHYQPPTWFQHNSERTPEMATIGYAWPIDRVVEWSRTKRGGKQIELFAAADRDSGCMRWGLCDTGGTR